MGKIRRPMVVEIAPKTYFINEYGFDSQYILVGEERALVIDTGCSFYDMKALVGKLTDKPYDVVVTHFHPDHAGGIKQFDEVYIHPADVDSQGRFLDMITKERELEYRKIMLGMDTGYKDIWGVEETDYLERDRMPVLKDLYDGQVFELGNREVVCYHTPGHSAGSCAFLDRKTKILFSGDAANTNVGFYACAVSTGLKWLVRLQKLMGTEIHQIFNGHTSYAGTIDVFSQSLESYNDVIEAFRSILRGDAEIITVRSHLFPDRESKAAIYGQARVGWIPDRLWEDGEAHIIP